MKPIMPKNLINHDMLPYYRRDRQSYEWNNKIDVRLIGISLVYATIAIVALVNFLANNF